VWVRILPFQGEREVSNKSEREKRMLSKRVNKRKRGYKGKKLWVELPYTNEETRALVERRTEEGYLLGWMKEKGKVRRYLRYREEGMGSLSEIKRRSKSSRKLFASEKQRWGRNPGVGGGRYRRQTTKGRKTGIEARKAKVGGGMYLWVK
jgi:ribosomal protein S8